MSDYDHIVIGAGPAGCAVAARLSEDPSRRVLLLEAGGRRHGMDVRIPAAAPKLFRSRYDWAFETAPQDALDGRLVFFPRGRTLGGCSAINMQMYIRGHRLDYDGWGLPGWSYDELLPYFRRAERNERGADSYHGDAGAWNVSDLRDPNPLSRAFLDAAAELRIPRNPDFNGAQLEGAGLTQVMQRRGRRVTAADAYLHPASRRRNLDVLADAPVKRIVIRNGRAEGVVAGHGGSVRTVHAGREVILCAGAIGSPHLLMLSGVGPAEHLRAHGVDVVGDLPGVGQNLQDHVMVPVLWQATRPLSLYAAQSPRALLRYLVSRRGLLTSNAIEAAAFVRSHPDVEVPDLELMFATALWLDEGLTAPAGHGFGIGPAVLRPRSRGSVSLASADPAVAPVIRPNYLSEPDDLRLLVHGVRLAREIAAARAFDAFRGDELDPGPAIRRDEEIDAWIRTRAQTVYHPVGTCRMGLDELAVVDPELRVRGVDGLRVADCSVMPTLVRGHTTAAATAIGERAADLAGGRAPAATRPVPALAAR